MNVLVTGGAGYIGSHAVKRLVSLGHNTVVLDNLSHGYRKAIDPKAQFFLGSVNDSPLVTSLLSDFKIDLVIHFAAFIEVGESTQDPYKYYANNFSQGTSLLKAVVEVGVKKFIFSSTAAVYGEPISEFISEEHQTRPINPYGRSKLMMEWALSDFAQAYGLGYAVLRYFNVAGAHPDGLIGEAHEPESHLIPRVLQVPLKKAMSISIFGTDYPTPDHTCVRDYVHVEDLISAHLLTFEKIESGRGLTYNVGSQNGFSVKEVIRACEKVTQCEIPVALEKRRAGDAAKLVAQSSKICSELGWKPEYENLETIVRHAWQWHCNHPHGYKQDLL